MGFGKGKHYYETGFQGTQQTAMSWGSISKQPWRMLCMESIFQISANKQQTQLP